MECFILKPIYSQMQFIDSYLLTLHLYICIVIQITLLNNLLLEVSHYIT